MTSAAAVVEGKIRYLLLSAAAALVMSMYVIASSATADSKAPPRQYEGPVVFAGTSM